MYKTLELTSLVWVTDNCILYTVDIFVVYINSQTMNIINFGNAMQYNNNKGLLLSDCSLDCLT